MPSLSLKSRVSFDDPIFRITFIVIILAITARVLAIYASFPHVHWADENFKFFEPAHRMAFGYGLIVWEFRDGICSPILPALFSIVFAVVDAFHGEPQTYIFAAQILLAVFSLAGVVAVVRMGARISPSHALIAGVAAATWYEIVYYAGRPLSEAVATTALLVALSLGSTPQEQLTRSRLMGIGASLGLALMLRIQLAPALLVAGFLIGRLQWRDRHWPMAAGAAAPILLFCVADWLFWGNPFASTITNVRVQLLQDKASLYGTAPAGFYLETIGWMWGRSAWPILLALIAFRIRSSLLWIAVALVILATHSLVPHKEYRFIFPALACLVVTAAMGSADLVEKLRMLVGPQWTRLCAVSIAVVWIAVSAARPFSNRIWPFWHFSRELLQATFELPRIESLCGVFFRDFGAAAGGGYAYIHRRVPIYGFGIASAAPKTTEPYNVVVLKRSSLTQLQPQFRLRSCFGPGGDNDVCVAVRDGACKHDPSLRSTLVNPNI